MESLKNLRHPDCIEINGEEYQVISNTSLWYHKQKKELEMVLELVKVGEKNITPRYRLVYSYEHPNILHFLEYRKMIKPWEPRPIKTIKLL